MISLSYEVGIHRRILNEYLIFPLIVNTFVPLAVNEALKKEEKKTLKWKPNLHVQYLTFSIALHFHNSYKEYSLRLLQMLFDRTLKGTVYLTSRVSCRMSALMRVGGLMEPNAVWCVVSLVIHRQTITAGWLKGSYYHVINTHQCTCLSSNLIRFSTQFFSVTQLAAHSTANWKLKYVFGVVPGLPHQVEKKKDQCQIYLCGLFKTYVTNHKWIGQCLNIKHNK